MCFTPFVHLYIDTLHDTNLAEAVANLHHLRESDLLALLFARLLVLVVSVRLNERDDLDLEQDYIQNICK